MVRQRIPQHTARFAGAYWRCRAVVLTFGVLSPGWLWLSTCSSKYLPKLIPQHLARFAEPLRGSVRAVVLTFGVLSSGGADVLRALTGLALAFEVRLQSGAATDPPAYCEICRCVLALPCDRRERSHRAGASFSWAAREAWLQKLAWLHKPPKLPSCSQSS